ncbi:hypothetical protein [Acrocarpospora sp. B8E8]|uniref:hypothetical protein n=1 Tax=Acrocarpospora sp. B8E8 TaxID=3153572 RepID=UPI00325C457D
MQMVGRRQMPRRRRGHTTQVTIGGESFTLIAAAGDDGLLSDVVMQWGKHGTATSGLMDLYAMALTIAVRHHVPLAELIAEHRNLYFVPNGSTDDPDIPRVRSVIDWVVRRLALDWLPYEERTKLGLFTLREQLDAAAKSMNEEASMRPVPAQGLDTTWWVSATTIGA